MKIDQVLKSANISLAQDAASGQAILMMRILGNDQQGRETASPVYGMTAANAREFIGVLEQAAAMLEKHLASATVIPKAPVAGV